MTTSIKAKDQIEILTKELSSTQSQYKYYYDAYVKARADEEQIHAVLDLLYIPRKTEHEDEYSRITLSLASRITLLIGSLT
jgi:hypothetical protein